MGNDAGTGGIDLKVGCPAADEKCRHLEAIDQKPETAGVGWLAVHFERCPTRSKEWE